MTFYYKTKDKAIVAAMESFFEQRQAILDEQNKFAKRFGGVAMHSMFDYHFIGVSFSRAKPLKSEHLWTKADKHGMRRPLQKWADGDEGGAKLRALWDKHLPKGKMEGNSFLEAIGVPQFVPGRSHGYFLRKGTAYLVISSQVADKRLSEILGSEYFNANRD